MTTNIEFISSKDYSLNHILDDESDFLDSFSDHSGYIGDAIMEMADSYTPIYNGDIWDGASKIADYIEQAISEGIAPTEGSGVDLMKIFQSGYYVYYSEIAYENLATLMYNYIAEKVNEHLNTMDTSNIDLGEVESELELAIESKDNNDSFDDLDDIATGLIERIDEGEFNEE